MNLKLMGTDNGVMHILCEGEITNIDAGLNLPANTHLLKSALELGLLTDPLARMVGPGVYSQRVLLNLEKATYMDSSGIGWLVRSHQQFKREGGGMVLVNVPPRVRDTLSLMKLTKMLQIAQSMEEGLGLLKSAPTT